MSNQAKDELASEIQQILRNTGYVTYGQSWELAEEVVDLLRTEETKNLIEKLYE